MAGIADPIPVSFPVLGDVDSDPSDTPGAVIVTVAHGFELELDAGAWSIARRFDGTRTVDELGLEIEADGAHIGGARFVRALATYLEDVGALKYLDVRVDGDPVVEDPDAVVARLRHDCQMCGRSCQGHYIGPLDQEFVARLPALHQQMAAIFPDLADVAPTRIVAGGHRALTAVGDTHQCLYLGTDGRCRVHATLGAAAKPLVCRLFPYLRVRTESGVRAGITPRCYTFHRHFDHGPAREARELTGTTSLPWPLLAGLTGADAAEGARTEARLLARIERGDRLADVWSFLATGYLRAPVNATHAGIAQALSDGFHRLATDIWAESGPLPDTLPDNSHGAQVALLRRLDGPQVAFDGVPSPCQSYARHVALQWVHLRGWTDFPSFYAGCFVLLAGIVAASHATTWDTAAPLTDRFGFALTAWTRVMRLGHNTALLFPDEAAFEAVLRRSASGAAHENPPP